MLITLGTKVIAAKKDSVPFTFNLSRKQFQHALVIGKTATGKSTFLRNTAAEIMRAGLGLVMIDPHEDLIDDCANYVPDWRKNDLVYIDPKNGKIPGIGLFDYADKHLNLRILMTLLKAFAEDGWGKQTASIFRNMIRAVLELFERPTLINLYMMLADDDYANAMLSKCKNPLTRKFHKLYWSFTKKERIERFSNPLNKIEELMEPGLVEFFGQAEGLNFRKLMDDQKIVFIKIPKSYLEERDARLLGAFIMMKFKVEASRRKNRARQCFIIADEFHNFITGIDVEGMFAESRKYGTHYIVASQTGRQLKENFDVVLGNVSHIFAFRLNAGDAKIIAENFGDDDDKYKQFVKTKNYHFLALTMTDGQPIPSNEIKLNEFPPPYDHLLPARKAMAWARENTGRNKEDITREINEVLSIESPDPSPPPKRIPRIQRK
jgi:hypothetical protein